jgi:serine/threonine protein kinase
MCAQHDGHCECILGLTSVYSVALKKLKMDQEKQGFPITSLREIRTLMACSSHENIVRVREIVVGDTLTQSVFPIGHCLSRQSADASTSMQDLYRL